MTGTIFSILILARICMKLIVTWITASGQGEKTLSIAILFLFFQIAHESPANRTKHICLGIPSRLSDTTSCNEVGKPWSPKASRTQHQMYWAQGQLKRIWSAVSGLWQTQHRGLPCHPLLGKLTAVWSLLWNTRHKKTFTFKGSLAFQIISFNLSLTSLESENNTGT